MTLEQEQILLAREVKSYNLSVVEELENEFKRKQVELQSHELALEVFEKELNAKAVKLIETEERLKHFKKRILELIHLHNIRKRMARPVKEVKEVKVKDPKVKGKSEEELKFEKEKEELQNVIFAALTNSLSETTGNEGTAKPDSSGT
jgi:hypothetical protein